MVSSWETQQTKLLFSVIFLTVSSCWQISISVTSGLSPPTIVSNKEEFILQPNSIFNISRTGKRNVVWAEPLPKNTFTLPGYYTATLFIDNATVENTGYYMCTYEYREGETDTEPDDEHKAGIYIFVPGKYRFECWNIAGYMLMLKQNRTAKMQKLQQPDKIASKNGHDFTEKKH